MRKLKVCHLLYSLGIGGIETLAVKLVNRMDPQQFEHMILCLAYDDALEKELRPGAAKVIYLSRKEGRNLDQLPVITRLFRQERPDVVHTRNWPTFVEGVLPSLLARVPGRVHSFDGLNADNLGEEPRRRILAQKALMPFVGQVVARSDAMRQAMCAQLGLSPARVQLIADGIDLERFDLPVDRGAVRARFGLAPGDWVVGIVARLDPVKDHKTLFRAVVKASQTVPALRLLVVGGGPLEAELRQEAASLPDPTRVVFTGPQLDVPSLYHVMDAYAQPSLYEGVSGSLLEAMAARLPVVSTAVGGTVDIVTEGQNGYLVQPGDDDALAQRLIQLHAMGGRELGDRGRALVEAQFSLRRVLELYSQAYRKACHWPEA